MSSAGKKLVSKPGKTGRSLEEVMVMRKMLNASDPSSWPEGKSLSLPSLSASLPSNFQQRGTLSSIMNQLSMTGGDSTAPDNEAIIRNLKEYCRALQSKVKTLESNLEGTVVAMQRELNETRKVANEQLMSQQKLLIRTIDEAHSAKASLAQMTRWDGHAMGTKTLTAVAYPGTGNSPYNSSDLKPKTPTEQVLANREERRRRGESEAAKQSAAAKPSTIQNISNHMTELDMKVLHLKELFRHGDPLIERRDSATKIVAAVRGFLQRRRYSLFQKGLREWKWLRCRQVIWLLDMRMSAKKQVSQGLEQVNMLKTMRTQFNVFARWVLVCKQSRPIRQQMYQRAYELGREKDLALLRTVFDALKLVTVGKKSTKHANESRRLMIAAIREELSEALKARGEIGIVPVEDIERVLYKRVLLEFLERKRLLTMKNVWANGLEKNMRVGRSNLKAANHQWTKVRAGRCFYAWSEWVFMVGAGLDRKRWSAPRKYQVRYNQKRIDVFCKLRLKRYVFGPWKEFFKIQWLVRKGFQRQISRFVRANFIAWRSIANTSRALRIIAIDNWKGYSRLLTHNPFHAWASFVRGIKNHQAEQQRIVNSYLRWKWRQRVNIIMKRWRHQALYGRIDGLYNRQMLISSLNEQKVMTSGLEKILASQTVEMDELRELTEKEIAKRKALEDRLKEAVAEIHKNRMFFHHSEQELRRNEAIVESMVLLNPRQIEHIKKLQPNFKFKTRKVHLPPGERNDADDLAGGDEPSVAPSQRSLVDDGLDDGATAATVLSGVPLEGSGNATPNPESSPQSRVGSPSASSGNGNASPKGMGGIGQSSPMNDISSNQGQRGSPAGLSIEFSEGGFHFGISQEDQILLDRAKWLVARFTMRPPKAISVPTLKPGQEIRTVNVTEVIVTLPEPEIQEKAGSDSDDDVKGRKGRRKRSDSDEEAAAANKSKETAKMAAEPMVKTVTTTIVSWEPSQMELPVRPPLLPSRKGPAAELTSEIQPVAMVALTEEVKVEASSTAVNESTPTNAFESPVTTSSNVDTPVGMIAHMPPARMITPDVATKMFLSIMDFLIQGDVSSFAPEDKHDWLENILKTHVQVSAMEKFTPASETVMGEKSWREALMYLRTMFPGGGNYSGVGVELDDADTAMYWRIADMRDNLFDNTKRNSAKMLAAIDRKRTAESGFLATGTIVRTEKATDDTVEQINVYASKLSSVSIDDRDEIEEEEQL